MTATIERGVTHPESDVEGLLVKSPYSVGLVEMLKELPKPDRRWTPEMDGWWVRDVHEEYAVQALLVAFGEVTVIGKDGEDDARIDRDGVVQQERLF